MKHLIPYFIQEQLDNFSKHGQFKAHVLFIDLSGFTPLTQTLMDQGSRGVEELSLILNEIFVPLVHLVYSRGGIIPYFAGDAFTAIFPDQDQDDSEAATFIDAALRSREYFLERQSRFGTFTIGLKMGLSYGDVEWGIVGRHERAFYFRGQPIEVSAHCQNLAKDQDFSIVLDNALKARYPKMRQWIRPLSGGYYFIPNEVKPFLPEPEPLALPELDQAVAEQFLPAAVVDYDQPGEFRTVISIFISFEGVDNHRTLNRFATIVLEQINNFSGYFKEIDFGDKGGVMVVFFGAPVSFENNDLRALEFVYALRQELRTFEQKFELRYRIGMTEGVAYTGIVGGGERCQYAAVGNRVNLAARLMTYADWGEVLVDDRIRKNRNFLFQHHGDIKYKGIQGNIPTFRLIGKNEDQYSVYSGLMVGRDRQMHQLIDFASPLFDRHHAGVAFLFGEAGVGKSRLTHEFRKALTVDKQVQWNTCQVDQILRKPFNPFIYFLRNYFAQSPEKSSEQNLRQFEARFSFLLRQLDLLDHEDAEALKRELVRTKSVLAALIGIVYLDSLWEQLDAKGRYQNTILAIINLFLCESLIKPTVIEVEDAHWMDENSQELLHELVRQIGKYPILLLITSRYQDDGNRPFFFDSSDLETFQVPHLEIDLNVLPPGSVREFSEYQLGGPIGEPFFQLLLRSTNSNPFYLEQLLEYFKEQELLEKQDAIWTVKDEQIELSSSMNSILTARIDRLSSLVKETVKAAAVIGSEFEVTILLEVMNHHHQFELTDGSTAQLLGEQIECAEQGQIWRAINEVRYAFRHALLREAAYSMQLSTQLQNLHKQIAEAIERLYANRLEERYVDLAFHYEKAGVKDKTCKYLLEAADHARMNFQNQQALDFYERLLKKLGKTKDAVLRVTTYLKKGKVLELTGNWKASRQAYETALEHARELKDASLLGQTHDCLGRVLMLQGSYFKSQRFLEKALELFESIADEAGIGRVKGNLGNLFFRRGEYESAKKYFEESISIGRKITDHPVDAQIVANMGLTYMNRGEYDEGIRQQKAQLERLIQLNDKQGMATIHTYIGIVYLEKGDYDAAMEHFGKGLELSEELGNRQLTSVALGNIGLVHERLGDFEAAMQHYVRDLEIVEEIGDKQGTAIALGLIGQLLNIQGEYYKAIEYLQKDLMISEGLGYQKGIAKAVNTLGDIFYFLKQYERSLHFYDRAIDVTRKIGNKLVLGSSLVEKGTVLLEMDDQAALEKVVREAMEIATALNHPDLTFEANLLRAKEMILCQRSSEARKLLHELLASFTAPHQQAHLFYQLYRIDPQQHDYRLKALDRYRQLYQASPRASYKMRIEELEAIKNA